MSKKIDYDKLQKELFNRIEGYATNVRKLYLSAFTKIINVVKGTELEEDKPFNFAEYGYTNDVQPILRRLYSQVYQTIRGGIQSEWLNANKHNDELVKSVFGPDSIQDNHFAKYFKRNQAAMDAFFARKSADGGLNLSQRIWKYTGRFKDELEDTLDLAIGEGTPAIKLASKVKEYLDDPDKFFRRFRYKVGEDENGNPIYGRKWKRRVFDKATGIYSWIDADPSKYNPGKGVYRSSARNAQRLTRTEINMAYRTADYDRWQQLDFVVGVEIKLSNNHPDPDICDDLQGKYPKDFKWTGWHPQCRCYMVPVLASQGEVDKMTENILDGAEPKDGVICSDEVRKMPQNFRAWIQTNKDRMDEARDRGTLPYFVKDNEDRVNEALNPAKTPLEIADERHKNRTPEQIATIAKAWKLRKDTIELGNSVVKDLDGISDVDTTDLQNELSKGHYQEAYEIASNLAKVRQEILDLQYLDNPLEVARQSSFETAKNVNANVDRTLSKIPTDLAGRKDKLEFEIRWIEETGSKKYPDTWKFAQDAYKKELARVEAQLEIEKIISGEALTWAETNGSKALKELAAEVRKLAGEKNLDKVALQKKSDELNKKVALAKKREQLR